MTSCDRTVIVDLAVTEIPFPDLDAAYGRLGVSASRVVRPVWPDEVRTVASSDGRLHVTLREPAVATPTEFVIEERLDCLPAAFADRVLSGPYLVTTSTDDVVDVMARVRFLFPDHEAAGDERVAVMARPLGADDDAWVELPTTVRSDPFVVTCTVDHLGLLAVVQQTA